MPQYAEWIQEVSFPAHTGDLEVLLFKGINVRFPFLILQCHFNTQVCFQHFLNRFSYFLCLSEVLYLKVIGGSLVKPSSFRPSASNCFAFAASNS